MAKGMAIILMVLAHTDFIQFGERFIYMFHMPLFFFLSGYCFKESHLSDFKKYAKKRIKGAYWPYVKWGLIFLFFHNILFKLHIYDPEFGAAEYGLKDYLEKIIKIVGSMTHAEPLLGGYWFLHAYFVAAFITFFTVWICKNKQKWMFVGGGYIINNKLHFSVN